MRKRRGILGVRSHAEHYRRKIGTLETAVAIQGLQGRHKRNTTSRKRRDMSHEPRKDARAGTRIQTMGLEQQAVTATDSLETRLECFQGFRIGKHSNVSLLAHQIRTREEEGNRCKAYYTILQVHHRRLAANPPSSPVSPTSRKCIQRPLRVLSHYMQILDQKSHLAQTRLLHHLIRHYSLTPHTPLPAHTPNQSPPWPVSALCGAQEILLTS
jgi:hypothetical protein